MPATSGKTQNSCTVTTTKAFSSTTVVNAATGSQTKGASQPKSPARQEDTTTPSTQNQNRHTHPCRRSQQNSCMRNLRMPDPLEDGRFPIMFNSGYKNFMRCHVCKVQMQSLGPILPRPFASHLPLAFVERSLPLISILPIHMHEGMSFLARFQTGIPTVLLQWRI
jgi:hypothetical protein